MKFTRYILLCLLTLAGLPALAATSYGSNAADWRVADANPPGATVSAITDPILGTSVIKTDGAGTNNSYVVGGYNSNSGWNNQSEHWVSWKMRTSASYAIMFRVQTVQGPRVVYYNQLNRDLLLNSTGTSIHHGLGSGSKDGSWQSWSRDISADVKDAEPNNAVTAINGLVIRGNVFINNISLSTPTVYSDAQNGTTDGWRITDNNPSGAAINNIADPASPGNNVIQLVGTGVNNSFTLGHSNPSIGFGNTEQHHFSWRSKATANFRVIVRVTTANGWRYLWYDTRSNNLLANSSGVAIHHGLGTSARNGQWHSHTRDLLADLHEVEPDNSILTVDALIIRGSISIDDVSLGGTAEAITAALPPPMPSIDDYEMVFNDEFNGGSLDASKWNTALLWGPYLPINGEQQLYVDTLGINQGTAHSPFNFTGDSLEIIATAVSGAVQPPTRPAEEDPVWDQYPEYRFNGPDENGSGYSPANVDYLSGVITSYESFKMTHGYVETRAKMPAGQGLWPAFWLLNTHYVEDSPEIDVVEFLGQETDTVYHTYHYFDTSDGWQKISTPTFETVGPNWTESFHTFGLIWSPKELIWYVDGVEVQRITDASYEISKQAMYLIANLAVGGTWPGPADNTTPFPAKYEIDYIRAYKKKLNPTLDLAGDYQMMFNDEFNGSALDPTKWNTSFLWGPYLTINNEEQYYVDINNSDSGSAYSPFSLANGTLSITADLSSNSVSDMPPTSLPGPNEQIWQDNPEFQQGPYPAPPEYTSGLITSYDAFKFVNGYAEIRAKVPDVDGLWPAFWLLNAYYVGPLPEIDIMEIIGETPNTGYHTFHRSDTNGSPVQTQFISQANPNNGYANDFHTYGVRWRPGEITWYVDNQVVDTYTEPGVNKNDAYQLMYVIANLAVGGNFNNADVDASALPATYDIDYIRVYQEK